MRRGASRTPGSARGRSRRRARPRRGKEKRRAGGHAADERSSTPRRERGDAGYGDRAAGRTMMMCACRRGSGSDGSRLSGSPRSARARPRTVWDGKMLKNERAIEARQLQQSHRRRLYYTRTGDDSDQTRKHRSKSTLISPVVVDQKARSKSPRVASPPPRKAVSSWLPRSPRVRSDTRVPRATRLSPPDPVSHPGAREKDGRLHPRQVPRRLSLIHI